MNELYVLAAYDTDGKFVQYVRKGRSWSIVGYDSIASARRGLAHSRKRPSDGVIKIVKVTDLVILPE